MAEKKCFDINKLKLLNKWWRRRELNPRPKTFHIGIYILILKSESRFSGLLQAGYAEKPACKNLPFPGQATGSGYPAKSTPLTEPQERICQDDGRLSGHCVVIIVCDYVYFPRLTSSRKARYAAYASLSPSKPFRPLLRMREYI